MATFGDLALQALQSIGQYAAGESLTAADLALALQVGNQMIGQWANERLTIYTVTRTTWTITANDGSYTVGSGGDVNIARPVFVDHVNFVDTSMDPDLEMPLRMLTDDAYSAISLKALTSTYPQYAYYNPTYPTGTMILWPTPTSSTLLGAIYAPTAVSTFAAGSTSVSLPPGYEAFIVTNLAVKLAPYFEKQASEDLKREAMEAKAIVKRANTRLMDLSVDSGALIQGNRRWNIIDFYTGP